MIFFETLLSFLNKRELEEKENILETSSSDWAKTKVVAACVIVYKCEYI